MKELKRAERESAAVDDRVAMLCGGLDTDGP